MRSTRVADVPPLPMCRRCRKPKMKLIRATRRIIPRRRATRENKIDTPAFFSQRYSVAGGDIKAWATVRAWRNSGNAPAGFSLLNPSGRAMKITIRDCAVIPLSARVLRASPEIVFLILAGKSAVAKQVLTFLRGRQRDRDDRLWFAVECSCSVKKKRASKTAKMRQKKKERTDRSSATIGG